MSAINSITRRASGDPSIKLVSLEYARLDWACLIIMLPINSTAAGSISIAATVASMDSFKSLQCKTASPFILGTGTTFNFASVMVRRVPSEPTTNLAILKLLPLTNSSKLYPDTLRCIFGYRAKISSLFFSPMAKRFL